MIHLREILTVCNALKVIHFRGEKVIQPGSFYLIFLFPPPAAARGICFGC
jgi:hypothetical protein